MTPKQKTRASRFLSLILRHNPSAGNITVGAEGWASTPDVVRALKDKFAGMSLAILKEIVVEDEKGRYSFSAYGEAIRANHGHSLPINLDLVDISPPEFLFHGTARKTLWMIRRDGLLPMDRQYVHLSEDRDTAITVGERHGDPTVIIIKAREMFSSGLSFYRSENSIWLVTAVPVTYLWFEADDENSCRL